MCRQLQKRQKAPQGYRPFKFTWPVKNPWQCWSQDCMPTLLFFITCPSYWYHIIQIHSRASQLRGEIKTKAHGLAASEYGINGTKMTQNQIKTAVKNLTNKVTFTFCDPKTVSHFILCIPYIIHIFYSGKASTPMLPLCESLPSSTWAERRSPVKVSGTMPHPSTPFLVLSSH